MRKVKWKRKSSYGVEFYEFKRNGKKHVVVPAVGHLFNLKQTSSGSDYSVFEVDWLPSFQVNKKTEILTIKYKVQSPDIMPKSLESNFGIA